MVNDVYKASKFLTTDQKNWALFWRDSGVTTPGHWLSITRQVIAQKGPLAGAKAVGVGIHMPGPIGSV